MRRSTKASLGSSANVRKIPAHAVRLLSLYQVVDQEYAKIRGYRVLPIYFFLFLLVSLLLLTNRVTFYTQDSPFLMQRSAQNALLREEFMAIDSVDAWYAWAIKAVYNLYNKSHEIASIPSAPIGLFVIRQVRAEDVPCPDAPVSLPPLLALLNITCQDIVSPAELSKAFGPDNRYDVDDNMATDHDMYVWETYGIYGGIGHSANSQYSISFYYRPIKPQGGESVRLGRGS